MITGIGLNCVVGFDCVFVCGCLCSAYLLGCCLWFICVTSSSCLFWVEDCCLWLMLVVVFVVITFNLGAFDFAVA